MVLRILTGVGLFALGYYVGREIGKTEPLRQQLLQARQVSHTAGKTEAPAPARPQG